ncbi:MAG: peptide deformylase [Candidatus Paceibacterota bacterium]|jgi:peptide deformylase
MAHIVQQDDPVLRSISQEVPLSDIESVKIKKVIADMSHALVKEHDGVAIAAPQIGVPLRIFVISGRIFDPEFGKENHAPKKTSRAVKSKTPDLVMINPKIVKISQKKIWKEGEGCLSVRWLYGEVRRATNVTISAYNEHGKKFTRGAGGLLAHIFQHEIDHLDGILFIDKARHIQEVPLNEHHEL